MMRRIQAKFTLPSEATGYRFVYSLILPKSEIKHNSTKMAQPQRVSPVQPPTLSHLAVVYPPQHPDDHYTFKTFIELYEAYCKLKNWSGDRVKINTLNHYVTGRAERAYSCVLMFFEEPQDMVEFTFNHFCEHVAKLLATPAADWANALLDCRCDYCYHRPTRRRAYVPRSPFNSPDRSPAPQLERSPRYAPRSPYYSPNNSPGPVHPRSPVRDVDDSSTDFDEAQQHGF